MQNLGPTLLHEVTRLITKARRALYLAAARELGSQGEEMSAWVVAARLVERRRRVRRTWRRSPGSIRRAFPGFWTRRTAAA